MLIPLTSYAVSEAICFFERKLEFVSVDIHKPGKAVVARSGGVAVILSLVISVLYWNVVSELNILVLAYVLSAIAAGLLGLVDDIISIGTRFKLLLFCLPGLIPVALHLYSPYPYVPGIGHLRLTILYPLIVIAAFDIMANAFNMSDTHNGLIVSAFLIFSASLFLSTFLPGPEPLDGFYSLLAISALVLLGYLPLNAYPAKMLNGNSGSHLLGALATSLIITSRREFLSIMLLMPQILHGYLVIATTGLRNKEVIERPTKVGLGGVITANCGPKVPITLVRMFVIEKGLTERELIIRYVSLQILVSAISLTLYLAISLSRI